jgi:hypothetical protein
MASSSVCEPGAVPDVEAKSIRHFSFGEVVFR